MLPSQHTFPFLGMLFSGNCFSVQMCRNLQEPFMQAYTEAMFITSQLQIFFFLLFEYRSSVDLSHSVPGDILFFKHVVEETVQWGDTEDLKQLRVWDCSGSVQREFMLH